MYFILLFFFCLFGTGSSVYGEQDVWLIDTYQAPWNCASEAGFKKAVYYQLVENRWIRSDAESFFETQTAEVPLVLYCPAYTLKTSDTVETGMALVRLYEPGQNCRTVFWNWPAEKIRLRLAPDIRDKIAVAVASGDYMAMFLRQLKPESQVCMISFSFGNRIICDATVQLGDNRPDGMRIHLILTGSATDQDWLASGSRHGDVPRLAEKILIFYNPSDFKLRFYPFMYGNGSRPDALGNIGPPLSRIAADYRDRIEGVNVQPYLGRKHRTVDQLRSSVFRQRMSEYLFFQ